MPRADPHARHRTHEERLTADLPTLLKFSRLPLTPFTEPQMSEESSKGHDADKSEAGRQSYPPQKKAEASIKAEQLPCVCQPIQYGFCNTVN